jgi:putative membrane protein
MTLNDTLALINAVLTLVTLLLIRLGFAAIRRRDIRLHRALMLSAFGCACVFLVCFVARIILFGLKEFRGTGVARVGYYVLAASHDGLAVVNVPLVLVALGTGLTSRWAAHREVVRMALPVWTFVTVSGVAIYVVLYRL